MRAMVTLIIVLAMASSVQAVVLHDNMMPEDRPPDGLVGRWGSSGSCVVVHPDWVIASIHQGGGVGTTVQIAGVSYKVAEVRDSSYDLRLARLVGLDGKPANLSDYADLSWETTSLVSRDIVMGGFGKGRGSELTAFAIPYGYTWSGSSNSILRWGSNIIDAVYGSILVVDFDALGDADATMCEGANAAWDSGGGWFVWNETTGRWEVVGLSVSTERSGESRFRSKTNPLVETKDRSFALAIAVCADWIVGITGTVEQATEPVPEPEPATAVLVVVGGTGGGQYTVGSMVSIVADVPVGYKFIQWTGDVAMVDDAWSPRTTVVVDDNATIMAVYGPDHSLNVIATLDKTWVYQNSPVTRGRHGAVLTLAVEESGEPSGPYQVTVTQSGDGDQVALVPTDDPLVWLVLGGTARQALPGEVTLRVSVTDATGECCAETSCSLNVRLLGDVNGDGIVDGQDVSAIVHVLNGRAGAGYDPRVFDLDVNGGVEPTDMSILIYSMTGATVSVRGG